MKPRINLFTLWVGRLPTYSYDFAKRLIQNKIVQWCLVPIHSIKFANQVMASRLNTPCHKESGYALSDVRPMLAAAFPREVKEFDWWGWVEVDTVVGDLDNLLPPLLDQYDAISCFPDAVSGPLMLFRNCIDCNSLFELGNWKQVLAEPSYCNYEETQAAHVNQRINRDARGGMTEILKLSGLRVHWDDRFSLTYEKDPAHPTPAGCRMDGNKLIEVPTGRELLIYHFNHLKRWPVDLPVSETEKALQRRS